MTTSDQPKIAFIGFGEAAQALASGLAESGVQTIAAWDILFPQGRGAGLIEAAGRIGVRVAASAAEAVAGADIVVSAVTASSSLKAADSAKPHMTAGQFFLDINSVSPARKRDVGAQ